MYWYVWLWGGGVDFTAVQNTVRPRLSGPLLSGSLAIRKKIVGHRFTAYVMHTYRMCVRMLDQPYLVSVGPSYEGTYDCVTAMFRTGQVFQRGGGWDAVPTTAI